MPASKYEIPWLHGLLGVSDPAQSQALNYGILNAGLGILANSSRPWGEPAGVGIGRGALYGVQAYQDALAQQQQQQQQAEALRYRQQQAELAQLKFSREQKEADAIEAAIARMSEQDPANADYIRLNPNAAAAEQFKTPMGFRRSAQDELIPAQIRLPDGNVVDYATYQQQLAQARAQMPGFGEAERLDMARDAALRAKEQNARQAAAAARADEALDLQRRSLEVQEDNRKRAMMLSVPGKIEAGYIGNNATLAKINRAIEAVKARPESFGLTKAGGDYANEVLDKKGVSTRAAVAKLANEEVHKFAGASQTFQEMNRQRPVLPNVYNDADVVLDKLYEMRDIVLIEQNAARERYSDPKKYRNYLTVGESERDAIKEEMMRSGELRPEDTRSKKLTPAESEKVRKQLKLPKGWIVEERLD